MRGNGPDLPRRHNRTVIGLHRFKRVAAVDILALVITFFRVLAQITAGAGMGRSLA